MTPLLPAEPSRTPPILKWLLAERAMLAGEIDRSETELARLQAVLGALKSKISALDATITLLDERVRPDAGGVVHAQAGRYGTRGGLRTYIIQQLKEAGEAGIDTVTLARLAATQFGLSFPSKKHFWDFRRSSVAVALRELRTQGLVGTLPVSRGRYAPSVWYWKAPLPTFTVLAATVERNL